MTLSYLIQLGLLLVTVAALLWSQYSDRQQRKLSMFAEYTKRYQDVILSMPDSVLMGIADIKTDVLKHLQLYFDLCSEEYYLWQQGIVPCHIWQLWSEGMQITMQNPVFRKSWDKLSHQYSKIFRQYFDDKIIAGKAQ